MIRSKYIKALLVAALVFMTGAVYAANTSQDDVQNLDGIVAIVNKGVITQTQLDAAVTRVAKRFQMTNMTVPPESVMQEKVLQQLIYQKIQLQLAKKYDISVTNRQVDQTIAGMAKQSGMTLAQLKQKVTKGGFTFAQFRKSIKQQMIIQSLQQHAVASKINVSPADIAIVKQKLSQQQQTAVRYHVVDVFIPANSPGAAEKAEATKIVAALNGGASLAQVAKNNANVQVNDMGWQTMGQLPNIFLASLANMKAEQVSQPILAPNGYHVLKLMGKQGHEFTMPSQDQLQSMAVQMKMQQAVVKWLEKLRKESYVKILLNQ